MTDRLVLHPNMTDEGLQQVKNVFFDTGSASSFVDTKKWWALMFER